MMYQEYFAFLEKYASFCEEMAKAEQTKRQALLKDDITRLESILSSQQAALMQLETLEKQRVALQQKAGWGDIPLEQILEQLGPEERGPFEALCRRMRQALAETSLQNKKAMQIANLNLRLMRVEHAQQEAREGKSYQADKTVNRETERGPLFETKI